MVWCTCVVVKILGVRIHIFTRAQHFVVGGFSTYLLSHGICSRRGAASHRTRPPPSRGHNVMELPAIILGVWRDSPPPFLPASSAAYQGRGIVRGLAAYETMSHALGPFHDPPAAHFERAVGGSATCSARGTADGGKRPAQPGLDLDKLRQLIHAL